MSHIVVGERIIGQAPQIIGHVVAGAGHFIEQGSGFVQEFARNMPEISNIVSRSIADFSDPQAYNSWQWSTLSSNYGEGSLMAANTDFQGSASERAWKESINESLLQGFDAVKDALLAIGSAAAGDTESAVAYGAAAAEKFVNSEASLTKAIWSGPTPGQGTCPMPGEGRPD